MMAPKPNESQSETVQITQRSDIKLEEEPKEELSIDRVMPRDLPRATDVNGKSGIHYIHFLDYWIERDREDPIRQLFRKMLETIARAELSVLQMQENVDSSVIPSSSFTVNMFHEDIQSFDAKGLAKIWADSMILSYESMHENSKWILDIAKQRLEYAEWTYNLWHMKFKRRLERQFKRRYGEGLVPLYELVRLDPELYSHLRKNPDMDLKVNLEGKLEEEDGKKEIFHYRERMIMILGDQAEQAFDDVRGHLWKAEAMVNAVFQKSTGYSRSGGTQAMFKTGRANEQKIREKQTSVQVVSTS